jgi:hypothetical protein
VCQEGASQGEVSIDSLPLPCNDFGPHSWPVLPGCWKGVIVRNDGPSVPPYITVCESAPFQIVASDAAGCSV